MTVLMVTFRPLQSSTRQVPQDELTVLTNTRKALCSCITPPRIERKASQEGRVTFAAGYYALLERRPYTCKIILTSRQDEATIRRPIDARKRPKIALEGVEQSLR